MLGRIPLGLYLMCAGLYEFWTEWRDLHLYSNSWLFVPRPGVLILVDWFCHLGRTHLMLTIALTLWLMLMGVAAIISAAALRLYVASEMVLLAPSVLYLLVMLFLPSGHAVPPLLVLLLQAVIISLFSVLPLWWSIRLIRMV